MLRNLDIGVLRSFLLIADGRSFAEAAGRVGRSPSAVSLQIQRLEDELGAQVFRRNNREVALTLAGERLLVFARRIVSLNDETMQAFRSGGEVRPLRVGLTQDFAESALPGVLRRFSLEHPTVELSLRIDRSIHLLTALHADEIDLAVAVRRDHPLAGEVLVETRMAWIDREGDKPDDESPVPLVLFEAPCTFRSAAIDALAAVGRTYRIGFTSPSLSGLRSAVLGGLGITVRTKLLLAPGLAVVTDGLPRLPEVAFSLYERRDGGTWPARDDFVELCRRAFQV